MKFNCCKTNDGMEPGKKEKKAPAPEEGAAKDDAAAAEEGK